MSKCLIRHLWNSTRDKLRTKIGTAVCFGVSFPFCSLWLALSMPSAFAFSCSSTTSGNMPLPGPIPDKSYVCMDTGLWRLQTVCGITQSSSGLCSPGGPFQSLFTVQTLLFQAVANPSVFTANCAQQVRKILSARSTSFKRMPILIICHLPIRIPNVHSTSFLIDSTHDENRISVRLHVVLFSGTVVGQVNMSTLRSFLDDAHSSHL